MACEILATAGVDGDEGAGADHFVAPRGHGNIGDAAGHGSAYPVAARDPLYGPLESAGGSRPRTPDADRGTMPRETPEAPLGQEGRGMTAAGIEMPGASC